jgi:lipid-A-disaccharide synthase
VTPLPKTIFISTGEVSGDLQGSLLVTALLNRAQQVGIDVNIVALGGQKMAAAGATIISDTTGIGSVGVIEALAYVLPTIRAQNLAKKYLKNHPPDVIIPIDYMTPNIAIGRYAKANFPKVPLIYYIAPQEWVWSVDSKNTNFIIGFTDTILAIFPEEAKYFIQRGAKVKFVGHPLIDRVAQMPDRVTARRELEIGDDRIAIALIPASRKQELTLLMPNIFSAAKQIQTKLDRVKFYIPLSRLEYREAIERAISDYQIDATLVVDRPDLAISAADYAITKCGTVSLELALLNIPQVVIYRVGKATEWIAKNIIKIKLPFVSPPNLMEMKPIVPELIQDEANPDRIATETLDLILNPDTRQKMLDEYANMKKVLGEEGVCDRVAEEIIDRLL